MCNLGENICLLHGLVSLSAEQAHKECLAYRIIVRTEVIQQWLEGPYHSAGINRQEAMDIMTKNGDWGQTAWMRIIATVPTTCMTWYKFLNLSVPQFLHL